MTPQNVFELAGMLRRRTTLIILISSIVCAEASSQNKLAVINAGGEVWVRDLSANDIGAGSKLIGPSLFGGPDDQFVLGTDTINGIDVVTKSGAVWSHKVTNQTIAAGSMRSGSLFGGPDAKYVVSKPGALVDTAYFFVVTTGGDVWIHWVTSGNVDSGKKLEGPTLFGAPNDKYVVYDRGPVETPFGRILVINSLGEVWAHNLTLNYPDQNLIGAGYKLTGPSLFGAPDDKYVLSEYLPSGGARLLVINAFGEVWARNVSHFSVGPGVKLNGPGLFGTRGAKYVVVYYVH
jgi:hypothetical protein